MTKKEKTAEEFNKELYERKRKRELEDLKEVVKTPAGRRVVWKILQATGYCNGGFHDDPNKMYYLAGRKDVGNILLDDLMQASPTAFATMQMEYYSEIKSEESVVGKLKESDDDFNLNGGN